MSHSTVTVFLPGTLSEDELEQALATALAPFDENKETPRYVKATKAELIAKEREDFETYRDGTYAEFLADPSEYAANCGNIRHLLYLAGGDYGLTSNYPQLIGRYMELLSELEETGQRLYERSGRKDDLYVHVPMLVDQGFPIRFTWSDDEFYAEATRWYDADEIGAEGEVYSEYNPKSKWDWYSIGGRWHKYWNVHPKGAEVQVESYDAVAAFANMARKINPEAGGADSKYVTERDARDGDWVDVARKFDIDFTKSHSTFAVLDSEGEWHEKGRMGWFGMSSNNKVQEDWDTEYAALVAKEADNAWVILVDVHI